MATKRPAALLESEKSTMPRLMAAFTIATVSGFITFVTASFGTWEQITYLSHTVTGIWLAILVTPYILNHYRRTLAVRRPLVLTLGIASVALLATLIVTGLHIALFGQTEAKRWVYSVHVGSAIGSVSFLLLHLLLYRLPHATKSRDPESPFFLSVPAGAIRYAGFASLGAVLVIGLTAIAVEQVPSPYSGAAAVRPYSLPYGKHPFRPSQTETTTGKFIDVKQSGASNECGTCHQEITRQWRASMHAQAASDKSYQTNIDLLAKKKGMAATRYCEGCHAPVALLSGELTEGGKLNTDGHMNEGVSCVGCHRVDKVMHLKGVASYRFAPAQDYLFSGRDHWAARKIRNFVIRIQPRQHRQDMAQPLLSTPQLCATCHAQFMDKNMNGWGWVKMQDEFAAWLQSPYSKQSRQTFAEKEITRCQDCHLPLTPIDDPSANAKGLAVSHRTLGANTAIPFYTGDQEQLTLTREFLQSDKMRISIDQPSRQTAVRSDKPVEPDIAAKTEAPVYFYLGEPVRLNIVATNAGVGHDFPGGTTDINEAWIHVRVTDAQNRLVYESGAIGQDNRVDPNAHFYRALAIDRNGHHVWKHDLFNMIGDSYKKVIPAGGADVVQYEFTVPSWAKGPLTVSTVVRYRKFNSRYARWVLKEPDIELPVTDVARDTLTIPLRTRKEAG